MFDSEQLDRVLFGTTTLRDLLIYVVVAAVATWILRKIVIWIRGSGGGDYTVPGRCLSCHWEGNVSKYRGVCPRCGAKVKIVDPRRR